MTHAATIIGPGATSPARVLLDYDVRTDGNPVYVGSSFDLSAATSTAVWIVQRLTYDSSSRLIDAQTIRDAVWDNRAALGWV